MASYNRPNPGPSRPLIHRPQSSAPQPSAYPNPSALGQSIAGALSGVRLPGQQPGAYPPPPPPRAGYWPAPPQAGVLPPRPQQHAQYSAGYPQPSAGYPYQGGPNPYGHHSYPYTPGPGPQGAFPTAAYPAQHYTQYPPLPPPQPYPNQPIHPHHSLPPRPTQNGPGPTGSTSQLPRTTPDGYTISSTYSQPKPSTSNQNGNKHSATRPPNHNEQGGTGPALANPPKAKAGGGGGGPQVVNCQVEGCTFSGGKRAVREHEEDRHLIYLPGREPKPWSGSYESVNGALIEGTAIALDSAEAVAKWIEERKKRWPSHKVVEEKEKLHPGSTTRGGRGGRGRGGRGRGGRMMRPNGGAGGIWGDDRPPEQDNKEPAPAAPAPESEAADGEPARKKVKRDAADGVEREGGLGSEAEEGASGEESEDDDGRPVEASSRVPVPALFPEGEAAEEAAPSGKPSIHPSRLAAQGAGEGANVDAEADAGRSKSSATIVCRYFKTGKCHQGDHCPFLHTTTDTPAPPPKRKRPAPPPPAFNPFARADPFAQLAERDWSHLVSDALQAIEFLEGNNWLRGVELRPGQVEEESGIEVLAESKTAGEEGEDVLMGGREAGIVEVEEAELRDEEEEVEGDEGEEGEGYEDDDADDGEGEDEAVAGLLVKAAGTAEVAPATA